MKAIIYHSLGLAVLLLVAPLLVWAEDDTASGAKPVASALQPFVDRHALAGAVTLVADKDRVLDLEAVGFADIANNTLMGTDTLFWIASQSKPITALALMMLVDEGKVSLDDSVAKFVPEFGDVWVVEERSKDRMSLKRPEQRITVRHILSHTSGLPFASVMERPTLDVLPLRDAARSYAMTPLLFQPGTEYQYSNAGINTAGRIIEIVSGMPYEDFLQKRLFDPLGMKDTTFWPNQEQLRRLAKSYRPNKDKTDLEEITVGQLKYPLNDRHRQPMPAGGLFATTKDVGRFCQMMLNRGTFEGKRYVSENAVKEMTRKQTGPNISNGYGLGWSTGGGSFGHGGAHSTDMSVDTKRGLVFVYMVQHAGFPKDGGRAQGEFRKVAEARFGRSAK